MRTGTGIKGVRSYDWAMLEVAGDDAPPGHGPDQAGHSVLLIRRHRYSRKRSYYRCWSPVPVPLWRLVEIATRRWKIEEDHFLTTSAGREDAEIGVKYRG